MQTEELQIKIGKKLKELRNLNKWTQEQIAEQLHICRNAYGDIELGKTDICLSRLAQLANCFGVDITYFVNEQERIVFYLAGTQNTQFHSQRHEYHVHSEEKLQNELEKAQLTITHLQQAMALLQQQVEDKQKIIAVLEIHSNP